MKWIHSIWELNDVNKYSEVSPGEGDTNGF